VPAGEIAAREGFVVLYPEQDRLFNPNLCWNWFDTRNGRAYAEVGLIMQMIDQACLLYGADRERVAIAGLSAGASMAALVVTRHPERFKAVAMHSGVPPGTARSGLGALSAMYGRADTAPLQASADVMAAEWPALLVIHGSDDRVVKPSNGLAAVRAWSEAAGARAEPPRLVQRGQRLGMAVTDYRLQRRTVATLVEVANLGHAWSGGAASQAYSEPKGPDASRLLWAFANRQFRLMA
jgi:poly(hydroxyalkanoate) depolymerase family esterase